MSHHLLPLKHFHLIFTLPHELNDLIFYNKKRLYGLLFGGVNETIKTILGGKIGMVATLHSWGSNLSFHPHIHVIIPAGSYKNGAWLPSNPTNPRCFCNAKKLRETYKNIFLKKLLQIIELESLQWGKASIEDDGIFPKIRQIYHEIERKKWTVRIENPVLGVTQIIEYLARYVRRVAITNSRIEQVNNKEVVINYKQYSLQKKGKPAPIGNRAFKGEAFLQQFSQHFMPWGFHKVRYYGFYAFGNKQLKATIHQHLTGKIQSAYQKPSRKQVIKKMLGQDIEVCTNCGVYDAFVTEILTKESNYLFILTRPNPLIRIRAGPDRVTHKKVSNF